MPGPVKGHIRQVPGQPPYRLGRGRLRHQRHGHHQPHPLRRRHPPIGDGGLDQVLDHPVAQVPFQLTQAHMIGQPAPRLPHRPRPTTAGATVVDGLTI